MGAFGLGFGGSGGSAERKGGGGVTAAAKRVAVWRRQEKEKEEARLKVTRKKSDRTRHDGVPLTLSVIFFLDLKRLPVAGISLWELVQRQRALGGGLQI